MFVRKGKPAGTISRPTKAQQESQKNQPAPVVKALGGWDGEDEKQQTTKPSVSTNSKPTVTVNIFGDEEYVEHKSEQIEGPTSTLYSFNQLSQMENLQHQIRLVEEIVQPGGIKVKPNQGMLNEFAQAAKTLDKNLIGSLLISKLQEGFAYAVKAKALYTIEYLAKKNQTYKEYFQQFTEQIRNHPEPSDNSANYSKLLNEVLGYIEDSTVTNQASNQANLIQFGNGPDYNKDLPWDNNNQKFSKFINNKKVEVEVKEQPKKPVKKFISPNDAKKIQKTGPQNTETLIQTSQLTVSQQKPKPQPQSNTSNNNFNIFDLELSGPTEAPKQAPQPQPHPLANLYQTPIPNMNQLTPQQYQQYLYQQQLLQQQMLNQQNQQQFLQSNQSTQKPITGAQLYSMYK